MTRTIVTNTVTGKTVRNSRLCVTIAPLLAEIDDLKFAINIGSAIEMPGGTIIELDDESFAMVRLANGDGSSLSDEDRTRRVRFKMKNWVANDVDCSVSLQEAVASLQMFYARPNTIVGHKTLKRCTHSSDRRQPGCPWCLFVAIKAYNRAQSDDNSIVVSK